MENMIKKIVDADDEAKALEQKNLLEKEKLSEKIEDDAKRIYEEYMKSAEETVKRNDEQEEKEAQKQLADIKNKQKSAMIKLKSDYERNCDKWVDRIVERTLE